MKLRVIFYGVLKQITGVKAQTLEIEGESVTVEALKALLKDRYPALDLSAVACAVGDSLVGPEDVLHDGDEAALLPPVSGGSG